MSSAPEAVRCPVCGDPVADGPTLCPECDTPHHDDCWAYNGGCAIYGCPEGRRQRIVVIDDSQRLDLATLTFDAASGNTAQSATAMLIRIVRAVLVWVLATPFLGSILSAPLAILAAFGSRRWHLNPEHGYVEEAVTLAGLIYLHRKRISFLDVENVEIRPQVTETDGRLHPRLLLVLRRIGAPNLVLSARRADLTVGQIDDLARQLRHGGAFHVVRPRKLPLEVVLKHLQAYRSSHELMSETLHAGLRPILILALIWPFVPARVLASNSLGLMAWIFFLGGTLLGAFSGRGDPYLPPVEFSDLQLSIQDPLELVDGALAELQNERHLSARIRRNGFGFTFIAFVLMAFVLAFGFMAGSGSSLPFASFTAAFGLLVGFAIRAHWEDGHMTAWLSHAESILEGLGHRKRPDLPSTEFEIEESREQGAPARRRED